MDKRLKEEYDNLKFFLKQQYNLSLEAFADEMKVDRYRLIHAFLYFLVSLKIWEEHLLKHDELSESSKLYFRENVSNIVHAFLLAMLNLNIPSLIMMRRTQENLLVFLYCKDQDQRWSKREEEILFRPFKTFSELKEYIRCYPFDKRYDMDSQKLKVFLAELMQQWTKQYRMLSDYVHASNIACFSKESLMDALTMSKEDYRQMEREVSILSSLFNTLMVIFFFEEYALFDEGQEKYFIRHAIHNEFGYKNQLMKFFHEI